MAKDPYKYFRIEARELLDAMSRGVMDLEKGAAGRELVAQILRHAHTLKGASRVVKQPGIADFAHKIEEVLAPYREGAARILPEHIGQILKFCDEIGNRLATLDQPAEVKTDAAPQSAPARPAAEEHFDTVRVDIKEMDTLMESLVRAGTHIRALGRQVEQTERARIAAGQLSTQLGRALGSENAGGGSLRAAVLAEQIQQQLEQLRRDLSHSVEHAHLELAQARELSHELRLLPAVSIFGALERSVRDAAQSAQKNANFAGSGGETRLDGHVLAALRDALLHVVRNAVAHGIEPEHVRVAHGKLPAGVIALHVERRGNRVAFICKDDGQGVDAEAVRKSALERKLLPPDELKALSVDQVLQLIFQSGVTTSAKVTELSGRGVGLDVVRTKVEGLKGTLALSSKPGRGTTVEICVPVSLSSLEALNVEAEGFAASIPLDAVRETMRLPDSDIAYGTGGASIAFRGAAISFIPLTRAMQRTQSRPPKMWVAVIVEMSGQLAAVGVERLLGTASVVVRPLPPAAAASKLVAGVFLDGDGVPQLLLDPSGLVAAARAGGTREQTGKDAPRLPLLVIDDSLTTRMLEQSILASAGYDVDVACSAEEGLTKARERTYGVFICDVEMPGMNGFEFVETTRADATLGKTPAILVTSLNAPDDKARGKRAGACAYIVKSEFDQEFLLNKIENWWAEAMAKIRVLCVDDSLTVRKRMVEVLGAHTDFEVVGEAADGKHGIELCQRLRPDVITLDMMMPVMSGLAATEFIMAYCPTPILIVSASTNRGELFRTYEALAAGAVDVLDKSLAGEDSAWEQRLISAVRMVSRIKVITHPRARLRLSPGGGTANSHAEPVRTVAPKSGCRLVAIGASTGGPAALLNILNAMPETFPLPVLLLIHIGETFAASFAEWLDSQSPLRVRYAIDGDALPQPGTPGVIMAPPESHLELMQGRLRLTRGQPRHSCRPSVDVLFESLAREMAPQCTAALLTGMGRDGAEGLLALRRAGAQTFAQDEATSVVYGMPREAVLLGAASRVLALDEFAPAFCDVAGCEPRRAR